MYAIVKVKVAYTPKKILDEPVQKVFWTGSLFLNRFMVNIHRGNSVQSGSHNISTFEPVQTWYFSYTWVLNRFTVFEPVQVYEPVHNIGSNTEFLSITNWKTILRCNIPAVAQWLVRGSLVRGSVCSSPTECHSYCEPVQKMYFWLLFLSFEFVTIFGNCCYFWKLLLICSQILNRFKFKCAPVHVLSEPD